ncbi:MAG: hypothetical protein O3B75_07730, partial [Planctomycetota bacterium]|nr:hypothetical protein [Planctomycetota bacterium]
MVDSIQLIQFVTVLRFERGTVFFYCTNSEHAMQLYPWLDSVAVSVARFRGSIPWLDSVARFRGSIP